MAEISNGEEQFVRKGPRQMGPSSKIPEIKHWGVPLLVGEQKKPMAPESGQAMAPVPEKGPGQDPVSFLEKLAEKGAKTQADAESAVSETQPLTPVLPFTPRQR